MATNMTSISLTTTGADNKVVVAIQRALSIAPGNTVNLTTDAGLTFKQVAVVFANGAVKYFTNIRTLKVNSNVCYVALRPMEPSYNDTTVVVNVPSAPAMPVIHELQARAARRNKLKAAAMSGEKAAVLQRTDTWYCCTFKASDFVEEFDLDNGFKLKSWQGETLPAKANTYLAGLLFDGVEEMANTNNLVASNGLIKDRHLTTKNVAAWPFISVEYNLIKLEKKELAARARAEGKFFNAMDTLRMLDCNSGKLWDSIWSEENPVCFDITGVRYRAFVQSAAHAKIGKSRFFAIREDLWGSAMTWLMAGMDVKAFEAEKHSKIKPWFYRGLVFTGLTRRYSFEEMLPWFKRTVVLKDAKVKAFRKQWYVRKDGTQGVRDYEGMDNAVDGSSFMRQDFCDFLQSTGLEKDFCLSRLKPAGKGKLELDKGDVLPRTGKVQDIWGNTHNWEDVSIVLTESYFKMWGGYTSWEQYLEKAKPNFGWCQPSANSRTLNGQCLDGLLLSKAEKDALAEMDCNHYDMVIQEEGDFNLDAMSMAMRSLAMEGFTPKMWADSSVEDLCKKLQKKQADWERGTRRALNTMHYNRPKTFNQYLGVDAAVYAGYSRLKTRTIGGRVFEEVNCVDLPRGLLVLQRNPSACGLENAIVYNVADKSWGLSGVCHLMAGGATAGILSGADFDGDQIVASADKLLLSYVMRMPEGMEIAFDVDKSNANKRAPHEAAFGEMQNTAFQGGAQNAARALAPENWGSKGMKWGVIMSRFFSAVMQLGVDAGKYGYEMWPAWQEKVDAFMRRGYKLPGWKWTKSAKEGRNRVFDEMRDRLEIELGRVPTAHEVYCEVADKYLVAKVYAEDGKTVIGLYDPKEVRSSVEGGKTVKMATEKFGATEIANVLPDLYDVYCYYWQQYKNENADVEQE